MTSSVPTSSILTPEALDRALSLRDLTDPQQGPHAMQQLLAAIHEALAERWACRRLLHRASPLVSVQDNYDRLGYPAGGAARDSRYTRYVTPNILLRSQTSAMIPNLLRTLALDPPDDVLLICPGLVYRRDAIDRLHVGEPHQLDLWRIKRGRLSSHDLAEMARTVVATALPGQRYRLIPSRHPYTAIGMQIDVAVGGGWVEIGECGMAANHVLADAGLETTEVTGLAMGLGLDRLLMLRKGIDDIRLLRSEDPRVARQMLDLAPYIAVSDQPSIARDLSVAVAADLGVEEIGDVIREALIEDLERLESVELLSETPYEDLPSSAHARMGIRPGQKNVLLRLIMRDPVRALTRHEANAIRDRVYGAVHCGERLELAAS